MAIDFQSETLVPVKQSPRDIPGRPHISTVYRWVLRGDLETIKVGGRLFTSKEAIRRFINRCSNPGSAPAASEISSHRRQEIEAANRKLDAYGIGASPR